MRYLIGLVCVLALGVLGCGSEPDNPLDPEIRGEGGNGGVDVAELEQLMQNACVHREIGEIYFTEGRSLADGRPCGNLMYTYDNVCGTDPLPIASACVHYCAFDRCQPAPCQADTDCDWMIETTNTEYECVEYTIDEARYGTWCRERDPEPPPGLCDPCGGAFCGGNCAICPQCTG